MIITLIPMVLLLIIIILLTLSEQGIPIVIPVGVPIMIVFHKHMNIEFSHNICIVMNVPFISHQIMIIKHDNFRIRISFIVVLYYIFSHHSRMFSPSDWSNIRWVIIPLTSLIYRL